MLFDHGVPAPLRWSLGDHSVDLAKDYGWDTYQNGELLDAVEAECYEVFITTDKSLRHQQNLAVRKLDSRSQFWGIYGKIIYQIMP